MDGAESSRPRLLEMTGDGCWRHQIRAEMTVSPTASGCKFTVKIDLGGRPLFGRSGCRRAGVKGDIERSIEASRPCTANAANQ